MNFLVVNFLWISTFTFEKCLEILNDLRANTSRGLPINLCNRNTSFPFSCTFNYLGHIKFCAYVFVYGGHKMPKMESIRFLGLWIFLSYYINGEKKNFKEILAIYCFLRLKYNIVDSSFYFINSFFFSFLDIKRSFYYSI